ncbi:MAG TPA: hypothetical protein VFK02_29345 [Kofleriaceae bacterium]|nr:hypothetical protein [Kofleriaceae bacterium]
MTELRFVHAADGVYTSEEVPSLVLYEPGDGAPRSLADVLRTPACLLFSAVPPVEPAEVARRMRACWHDPALKLLWLESPDQLADPGELRGLRIAGDTLIDRGIFHFRNYVVHLHAGSRLDLGAGSLVVRAPTGQSARLYTEHGARLLAEARGDVAIDVLGPRPGCLRFELALIDPGLDRLDAGVRYFFPHRDQPDRIDSLRFRVFAPGAAPLICEARLHPLFARRGEGEPPETMIRFAAGSRLETYFRSPVGQPVIVRPGDQAGLVFERRAETVEGSNSDPWYLTPWGTFAVGAGDEALPSVMPGASGAELVQGGFDGSELYMTFRDGCPAFLPDFTRAAPSEATPDRATDALALDDLAHTSHVRFHGGQATYFAQPAEQPFFQPAGPAQAAIFLATPVANLPDHPVDAIPAREDCVPVLPLAGTGDGDGAAALRLELRMAAPKRGVGMQLLQQRSAAGGASAFSPIPARAGGSVQGVTPGGQVAEFSSDLAQWRRLVVTTGSNEVAFAIRNLDGLLRNALLTGRRVTVISDPIVFLEGAAQLEGRARLDIAGWDFDLDPKRWFRDGTVLVFKDHPESLAALIERPGEWTAGQVLNIDPFAIAARIRELAAVAERAVAAGDDDFAPFLYQVWRNPYWNGFLAFNAAVSPVGLPDDLAVIMGGVDPSKLRAHHIGVSSSAVERNELGAVAGGRGSLFGLVDYKNAGPVGDAVYAWAVRELRARFHNARLANFKARIDLRIRELFGDPAAAPPSDDGARPADTIVLLGHYEEHDGRGRYSFRSSDKVRFRCRSGVVEEVVLARAALETTSVVRSADGDRMDVRGRFLLAGSMKFHRLEAFDVFSFDSLPVSDVALDLAFSVDAAATTTPASQIALSMDQVRIQADDAQPRPAALVRRFPLALDSLRPLAAGGLDGLKLASVVSPLPQTRRAGPGYVLEYRMDLGLGGKSYLTIVWWPDKDNAAMYLGLRIPGFDGSFSVVDGLIKVGPKVIQFLVDPATGETILLLRRIGIEAPLGLSLPPGGTIDAALFGDPNADGGGGKIGWYAAWNHR